MGDTPKPRTSCSSGALRRRSWGPSSAARWPRSSRRSSGEPPKRCDSDSPNSEEPMVEEYEWIKVARRELGQREVPGLGDNPRIVVYLKAANVGPANLHDETPWCASFVCWCLEQSGIRSTRRANARS